MKNLVKGYMTRPVEIIGGRQRVRHVAVFADGTIKQTIKTIDRHSNHFNHCYAWEVIATLPDGLEFIGNYPADM
jgi:hypothetical protein